MLSTTHGIGIRRNNAACRLRLIHFENRIIQAGISSPDRCDAEGWVINREATPAWRGVYLFRICRRCSLLSYCCTQMRFNRCISRNFR